VRFLGFLITVASVLVVGMVSSVPFAQADFGDAPEGGSSIILNLQLDGTYYDDSGAKRRLCDDGFSFFSTTTPPSIEMPGAPGADYRRTVNGVEQILFWTACVRDASAEDAPGVQLVRNPRTTWVGVPTPGAVIPTLFTQIQELIAPPIVSWPTMDPEFGWLYVNADMEFRVAALTPVTASGTLTNILASVSASQTATPVSVTFFSGEPGGGVATCSIADATAPFAVSVIGACTYKYRSSSAVSANGRTFDTRMVVTWEMSGDLEPGAPTTLETYVESPLAVAEVQALACLNVGC
jgi:hypothetical protein